MIGQASQYLPPIMVELNIALSCEEAMNQQVQDQTIAKPANRTIKGDSVLSLIVYRLVSAYDPLRIYLFGSKARGDEGIDSDYDLMVVVPDDAGEERQKSRKAYEVLRGTGVAVDVLVWTQSAFEERLHLRASLPSTIIREGRLLHAS